MERRIPRCAAGRSFPTYDLIHPGSLVRSCGAPYSRFTTSRLVVAVEKTLVVMRPPLIPGRML